MSLGKQLRKGRSRAGKSLREVERETGISNGYLSQLESGSVKQPSPVHLHKLSEAYQLDYGELMRSAGYVPPSLPFSPSSVRTRSLVAGWEELPEEDQTRVEEYIKLLREARRARQGGNE